MPDNLQTGTIPRRSATSQAVTAAPNGSTAGAGVGGGAAVMVLGAPATAPTGPSLQPQGVRTAAEATLLYLNQRLKNDFQSIEANVQQSLHRAAVNFDLATKNATEACKDMDSRLKDPLRQAKSGVATFLQKVMCNREKVLEKAEKREEELLALLSMLQGQLPQPITVGNEIRDAAKSIRYQWDSIETGLALVKYAADKCQKAAEASKMSLPSTELMSYSGGAGEYLQFTQQLTDMLFSKQLPEVDLCTRALSCLRDEAYEAMRNFNTAAGVKEFQRRLQDNFGNPQHLRHHYMQKLESIEALTFTATCADARRVMAQMDNIVMCLRKCGQTIDEVFIQDKIIPRLPPFVTMMYPQNGGIPKTYDDYSRVSRQIISDYTQTRCLDGMAEAATMECATEATPKGWTKQTEGSQKPGHAQRQVNAAVSQQDGTTVPKTCGICTSNQHQSAEECDSFLDLDQDERFAQAKQAKLCLKCLEQHCNSRKKCSRYNMTCNTEVDSGGRCTGRHNPLVHRKLDQTE